MHKKIICFFLFWALVSALCGCNESEKKKAYERGRSDGYSSGYSNGYKKGKRDGYEVGYETGKEDGYKEGYIDGSKTYVKRTFIPSVGAAITLAFFFIVFIAFKRYFNKTIGELVNDFMLFVHNLYSYLQLRRKASSLERVKLERAALVAKVSSLDLYLELNSSFKVAKYENEFHLISLKIEQYLSALYESEIHDQIDEVRKIALSTLLIQGLPKTTRSELLGAIRMLLISKLSEVKNLMKYENDSCKKISKKCKNYIKHRKLYMVAYRVKRFAVVIVLVISTILAFVMYLYVNEPDMLHRMLSTFKSMNWQLLQKNFFEYFDLQY